MISTAHFQQIAKMQIRNVEITQRPRRDYNFIIRFSRDCGFSMQPLQRDYIENAETLRDREETRLSDLEKDFLYLDTLPSKQMIFDERNSRVWSEWELIQDDPNYSFHYPEVVISTNTFS